MHDVIFIANVVLIEVLSTYFTMDEADIDRWIETARKCQYLPEKDLKVCSSQRHRLEMNTFYFMPTLILRNCVT